MKNKPSIQNFAWGFINTGAPHLIGLITIMVLARYVEPEEFGVVAIILSVISILNVIVDSGLSHAVVRFKSLTQAQLEVALTFTTTASIFIATMIYILGDKLQKYLGLSGYENILNSLLILPVVFGISAVPSAFLNRNLMFKQKARLSIGASVASSITGLLLAYNGFGIWALVIMQIITPLIICIGVIKISSIKPVVNFKLMELKPLFGYSLYISGASVLAQMSKSLTTVFTGKVFTVETLGYFNRAESIKNMPITAINKVIQRVSFAEQANLPSQRSIRAYNKRIFRFQSLFYSFIFSFVFFNSKELADLILGPGWGRVGEVLPYLCIVGFFVPFTNSLLLINKTKERASISFFLELFGFCSLALALSCLFFFELDLKTLLLLLITQALIFFFACVSITLPHLKYNAKEFYFELLRNGLPFWIAAGLSDVVVPSIAQGNFFILTSAFLLNFILGSLGLIWFKSTEVRRITQWFRGRFI